jgi:hypothetical protein
VGVVGHYLAEPEGYFPDVILIRAYLCDVAWMVFCVIIAKIFTS